MNLAKVSYKPVGILLGAAAGAVAGAASKRIWRVASGDPEPPKATEPERSWGEVLAAAALQGAVLACTKAVVDRGGATAVRRLTGVWPA
ncbi:DUF4235 domain-containing protein [Streptacidiphilus rugosus]|uniref:DUF4235 domain-containing protein n=1 Tax=Streptacidiphilus rugosus TaxID=405783 RepID=UPI000568277E|nr:DUF4235 domain-containing protein [Streptacidiphilus rugosus]